MALEAGVVLGQYRIRRLLGEGGMGAVYEAVHTSIDRHVAIKVLHPKFATRHDVVARFFNEARAVNRVEHPSMVPISEANQLEDGTAYLVMDFLRGEPLSARIKRLGRLPSYEVVRIARQVASGLAAAHARSIVHRDLKPDNIMLVPDSEVAGRLRVRILDFGIAKLLESEEPGLNPVTTRQDIIMGTPRYMSPEQCRGGHDVDEKSDVYALGVMLYEALAGRVPFASQGMTELMAMHVFEQPPPLGGFAPEAPEALIDLVMHMLSKSKDDRPLMSQIAMTLAEPEMSPDVSMSSISLRGFVLPDFMRGDLSSEQSGIRPADSPPSDPGVAAARLERSADRLGLPKAPSGDSVPSNTPSGLVQNSGGTVSTLGGTVGERQSERWRPTVSQYLVAVLGSLVLILGGLLIRSQLQHPAPPTVATQPTAPPTPPAAPVATPPDMAAAAPSSEGDSKSDRTLEKKRHHRSRKKEPESPVE